MVPIQTPRKNNSSKWRTVEARIKKLIESMCDSEFHGTIYVRYTYPRARKRYNRALLFLVSNGVGGYNLVAQQVFREEPNQVDKTQLGTSMFVQQNGLMPGGGRDGAPNDSPMRIPGGMDGGNDPRQSIITEIMCKTLQGVLPKG